MAHENVGSRRVELRDDLLEVARAAEGSVVSGGERDGVQLFDPVVAVLRWNRRGCAGVSVLGRPGRIWASGHFMIIVVVPKGPRGLARGRGRTSTSVPHRAASAAISALMSLLERCLMASR